MSVTPVIASIGGGFPAQSDPIHVSGGLVSGTAAGGVQTYKGIRVADRYKLVEASSVCI